MAIDQKPSTHGVRPFRSGEIEPGRVDRYMFRKLHRAQTRRNRIRYAPAGKFILMLRMYWLNENDTYRPVLALSLRRLSFGVTVGLEGGAEKCWPPRAQD